jgi:hypothetical protein
MKFLFQAIFMLFVSTVKSQSLTSNLPIVIINTNGNEIYDEPKTLAKMTILDRKDGQPNKTSDSDKIEFQNYSGNIAIEIRGSTSSIPDKKPYGFTTVQEDGISNNNVSLLGMPEENAWILNALNFEPSLIRDHLAFKTAQAFDNVYVPKTRYCEVIINNDYGGIYLLMEKIKIDKNRVNLRQLETLDKYAPEVTGGYIVKADKTTGSDPVSWGMASYNGWTEYLIDRPSPKALSISQENYITDQFRNFETIMKQKNNSIQNGYPSIIDIPSFVDFMLINEIAANVDGYQFSTYFHKDRLGKLRAGPIWDFNLTYGNDLIFWGLDRSKTDIWQFDNGDNTGSKFWKDLYDDPTFHCYLTKRWKELTAINKPLNLDQLNSEIDDISTLLKDAAIREKEKWYNFENFETETNNIKTWLKDRVKWMDSKLKNYNACANVTLPNLVISKIHYNPKGMNTSNEEFIEITNNSNTSVNTSGFYFRELGMTYSFPNSSIAANSSIIIAADAEKYKNNFNQEAFGTFGRDLNNSGFKLILADAYGNTIDFVEYMDENPWPKEADGEGYYLQLNDLNSDNNLGNNWTAKPILTATEEQLEILKIYPNPTLNNLTFTSSDKIKKVIIYDSLGKIAMSKSINKNIETINIENLKAGNYILEAKLETDKIINKNFVKI